MVGFHRCSFTGSVFCRSALPRVGSPWRAELVARPGCRLHSTVVATYLSGKQDGDSDTEFRARNAQSWPVGELLQLVWWNIGETLVRHGWNIWGFFSQFFFAFQGSRHVVFFITASVVEARFRFRLCWNPRPNSSGRWHVIYSPVSSNVACWKITNSYIVDFPSYKAPFIVDFQLPCLITRG